MTELTCQFCDQKFTNKYNLEKHQKSAKYCLDIQNKNLSDEFKCEYCHKNYSTKTNLKVHLKVCREKENQEIEAIKLENKTLEIIKLENKKLKEECNKLKIDYKNQKDEYKIMIETMNILRQENITLKTDNSVLKEKLVHVDFLEKQAQEQKIRIKELEDKMLTTLKSVTTTAIKNTGTKTVNQTSNVQNLYQSLLPITNDHMKEQSKYLERKHIRNCAESIAYFANEYSYKDRVVCTDVSRKSFIFKDETGNIVKDPKGVQITRKFIETNKDELVRLLTEYSELYYDEKNSSWFTFEKKCKVDACLYAIQRGETGSNANYYTTFLQEFTTVLGRLTYNKKCERLEMTEISELEEKE
jgi:hypothetical protein